MPSFDIVSEVNQVEVRNAVDQTNKEVSTRFDFKGSDARVELAEKALTLFADDEFKLKQVTDILTGKLAKRGVDIRSLKYADAEKVSGNKVKQVVTIRVGVEQELAKKIVKAAQGQQAEGAGLDPGRRGARVRRQARRPAGRHRAGEEVDHRLPAAVQQLPRVTTRLDAACAILTSYPVVLRGFASADIGAPVRARRRLGSREMTATDSASVHARDGASLHRRPLDAEASRGARVDLRRDPRRRRRAGRLRRADRRSRAARQPRLLDRATLLGHGLRDRRRPGRSSPSAFAQLEHSTLSGDAPPPELRHRAACWRNAGWSRRTLMLPHRDGGPQEFRTWSITREQFDRHQDAPCTRR